MSARPRYAWENLHTPSPPVKKATKFGSVAGSVNQTIASVSTTAFDTAALKSGVFIVIVNAGCFENATPPTPPFVTGVSYAGLTFTERGRNHFINGGQVQNEIVVYSAPYSSPPAGGQSFSATLQNLAGINNFFAGATISVYAYEGFKDITQPFDPSGSLPAFMSAAAATITSTKPLVRAIAETVTTVANNNTTISGPGTWTIEGQNGVSVGGGAMIANDTLQDQPLINAGTIASPFTYANGSGASIVYLDGLVGF